MLWTKRNTLLLAYAAVLVAAASCQLVAGIDSRKVDPLNAGCVLPSAAGLPQVRVANLVPTSDVIDVCMRPAGSSTWGRPVLLNGGVDTPDSPSCATTLGGANGFAYGQVSIAFSAPAASVDVKFVPGGSTCTAGAIAEGDGLTLATNAVTTLMNLGGNGVANQLVALPEADSANVSSQRVRLVHAAPGTGPLDFGTVPSAQLPTTVDKPLLSGPVPYGGTVPSGVTSTFASASLQDNGYMAFFAGAFQLGAAIDGGSNKALFAYKLPGTPATYTMYVAGVAGDNLHPLRALTCDEDAATTGKNPLVLSCTPSQLSTISVDVFNPALYGPNSPRFTDRRSLIPPAIAGRDSDIMCLVEVDEDSDKNAILDAAKNGPYPYSYTITTNLSTPFTNAADQNGNVPPAPTAPPCAGVDSSLVNGAVSCAQQKCSNSTPDDPNGHLLGSTDCLIENCAAEFVNVQGANVACYDCLALYIASDSSWQTTQTSCTTDSRAPLGFSGAENTIILSKYPLSNTDAYILPSTFYRRSVLYGQVQLEDQSIDFYCGFLMTTLNYSALPYAGNYGGGSTDSQTAWQNEQLLEARRLVEYVGQKSGASNPPNPAIVVGDWRSSIGISPDAGSPPAGTYLPNDLSRQTMDLFQSTAGWTFATPPSSSSSWLPQCNFCPTAENSYNGDSDSYFVSQPILAYWPGDATTATTDMSLLFTQGQLAPLSGDAGQDPISPYYGVNVRVIRPH